MVDACMRQLRATGWLNFRMRAMLVSFAAYHLWLLWREPGLFLARQFLDFEPGIHWSQMQMQSGTTGINTLRIHSPAKQASDQDPLGMYVRQWVPEFGTAAYPAPIVDECSAVAAAKGRLYGLRKTREAHTEADAIQHKHGSRRSGLPATTPTQRRTPAAAAAAAAGGRDRVLAPAVRELGASNGALPLWDYTMFGVVVMHWTLVLTVALVCVIVRVMKGPAFVADTECRNLLHHGLGLVTAACRHGPRPASQSCCCYGLGHASPQS